MSQTLSIDVILFVYGTLKRGLSNNHFLAGQQFLGEVRTLPHYRLYDSGPYPCLVEDRRRGVAVQGEIWRVDAKILARLDELEDVPWPFRRREIDVIGIPTSVFAYLYQGDVGGMKDCSDRWPQST